MIVSSLAERPRAVGELAATLPISRSAVSQHLKVLKGRTGQRAGTGHPRIYRVNPAALLALRDQLDTYWQRALSSYADLVRAETDTTTEDNDE